MKPSPKKKKVLIKPPLVDGFLMRSIKSTYEGGKDTVVRHGATGLIALLISSVVPMLESWHAEKQHQIEVTEIKQEAASATQASEDRSIQLIKGLDDRTDKHIIEVENSEDAKIKDIWTYIGKQQPEKNNNRK